jgi:exonuclease SbcD
MKILHTADIHLQEYEDERWKTLNSLLNIGKNEGISIFVISGDLFNNSTNAEKLRPKIREIFSNNDFEIVLIPGNHDTELYKDMYFGENANIITDMATSIECGDVAIWGIPFEPLDGGRVLEKLHSLKHKLNPDFTNILLYHGELLDTFYSANDFGNEGSQQYMPAKLSFFNDLDFDYVLAGHFHSNFDIRILENGGYFVYPGSPISITKKETGKRKINLFEVGESPKEYLLNTPHFEEILIEFNPFNEKNPIDMVREQLDQYSSEASIIMKITGYINSDKIGMNENEVVEQIKQITKGRCIDEFFEFKDVKKIIGDEIFKSFLEKLEETDYSKERKMHMRDLVIRRLSDYPLNSP